MSAGEPTVRAEPQARLSDREVSPNYGIRPNRDSWQDESGVWHHYPREWYGKWFRPGEPNGVPSFEAKVALIKRLCAYRTRLAQVASELQSSPQDSPGMQPNPAGTDANSASALPSDPLRYDPYRRDSSSRPPADPTHDPGDTASLLSAVQMAPSASNAGRVGSAKPPLRGHR